MKPLPRCLHARVVTWDVAAWVHLDDGSVCDAGVETPLDDIPLITEDDLQELEDKEWKGE